MVARQPAPAWCPAFVHWCPLSATQSLLPSTLSSVAAAVVLPAPHLLQPSNGCTVQLSNDSLGLQLHQSQKQPRLLWRPATGTAPPTSPPTAWGRAILPARSCATQAGVGATTWTTGEPSVNMQGGRQATKATKAIKDIGDRTDTTVRSIRDKIVQWETWLSEPRRHFLSILASYIFWIQLTANRTVPCFFVSMSSPVLQSNARGLNLVKCVCRCFLYLFKRERAIQHIEWEIGQMGTFKFCSAPNSFKKFLMTNT